MGIDDAAGRRIREIAFDNIHELTMDESAAEELDPPAALRLGEIDVPTLVADRRARSALTCAAPMKLIGREVLDGRSVTLEADHVINLRSPEAFDAAVLPFLAETADLTDGSSLSAARCLSAVRFLARLRSSSITFCARCWGSCS